LTETRPQLKTHRFLPNSEEEIIKRMLEKLGIDEISQLFSGIPESVRLNRDLLLPETMSEIELERMVNSKLSKNLTAPEYLNFLGGGIWLHHVPAIIDEILSRGEFYTSYTPYQPEISQGMLQGLFEYQSQICDLTSMDVANSSLYDWGTAVGEAGRMAYRVTKRKRILVGRNVSPERVEVLKTYTDPLGIVIDPIEFDSTGRTDYSKVSDKLDNDVGAVYVENPNFFGIIEDELEELFRICHSKGALAIVGVNPISLGLLRPPGSYGADIVVGDGQPLGLYPNFGGPLMGIFATRSDPILLRQMPGRLIGATQSLEGSRRGYTMVLQTREQHIRREQATSNICTNEALFALAVSICLASLGPQGMKEIGEYIVSISNYALKLFKERGLDAPFFTGRFFGDLSIRTQLPGKDLSARLVDSNILGGLALGRYYQNLEHVSIFSFSELHSAADVKQLADALTNTEKGD
jgi:glycine dehydrogenase subunit 1